MEDFYNSGGFLGWKKKQISLRTAVFCLLRAAFSQVFISSCRQSDRRAWNRLHLLFLVPFVRFLATNQVLKCFNGGMSVNMIHCCLQCSWVKDEQWPCIIQSDTVLRHIGQGNWSQSCLQGRRGQLPWEIEAEAHRGIAINTSHDLNSFTTKWQFM